MIPSMNATICPTVTVDCFENFQEEIERIARFAHRIHIDAADGTMTPNELIPVDQIWWPGGVRADIHLMCLQPGQYLDHLLALGPQLVVVHAEAKGDYVPFATQLRRHGVETGVALQQQTPVSFIEPALDMIDHVLVFSGNLGSYGGQADLELLDKVRHLKQLKPQLEIGWDGGINDQNARQLAEAGVEVLNVGGFIQRSADPEAAYATLVQEVS